jgi:hypothetical protein
MNSSRGVALAILLILTVGFFIPVFDQDRATVRRTRDLYERTHPGERTYDIEDLGSLLDPADSIMPRAGVMTYEKWKKMGGAIFGASQSFDTSSGSNKPDSFTLNYFQDGGILEGILIENLLTDPTAFRRFLNEHRQNGFYRVAFWRSGYLMFYMLESRKTKTGINFIVVPVKPTLFEKIRAYKRKY